MAATRWTERELADLAERLRAERDDLADQLSTIEDQSFATTQSDLSGDVGVDDESADAGTATFEREKELSIEQNVRDLIAKIERALKRIDNGTFGVCDLCEEAIGRKRLEARPETNLCIRCKEDQEREERTLG